MIKTEKMDNGALDIIRQVADGNGILFVSDKEVYQIQKISDEDLEAAKRYMKAVDVVKRMFDE